MYSLLLRPPCTFRADPEQIPARLIRGELAFELAFVSLVQLSAHHQPSGLRSLGGDHGMQLHGGSDPMRGQAWYTLLLRPPRFVRADPEPMLARLIRDGLAYELAFVSLLQPSARQPSALRILDGDTVARSQERLHAS